MKETRSWDGLQGELEHRLGFKEVHRRAIDSRFCGKGDFVLFADTRDGLLVHAEQYGSTFGYTKLRFEYILRDPVTYERRYIMGTSHFVGERVIRAVGQVTRDLEHVRTYGCLLDPWQNLGSTDFIMVDSGLLELPGLSGPAIVAMEDGLRQTLPEDVQRMIGYKRN